MQSSFENKPKIARYLVDKGISVMGHIGLTAQTITDFKVQGKAKDDAKKNSRMMIFAFIKYHYKTAL